ncbi:MAG TPA: S16 family serine protease, partial [Nitrospira sp.]|nr:S16 family serine protease [Nitrospira sp.]
MEKLTGYFSILLVLLFMSGLSAAPVAAGGAARMISVPALGVQGEGQPGVVNYILIQFDRVAREDGPTIQFNEINLGGGSLVGEEWKEGVRRAVLAATRAIGDAGRDWLITIKNRSMTSVTDGMSAGAAVAVGIMALYRGDAIRADVALSGQVAPDGRLDVVGGLPVKIEAAAGAH